MKQVKIAEFKAHLSKHLRAVQKGEEVTILDREHPIAKVIPFPQEKGEKIVVRPAKIKGGWDKLKFPKIATTIDVVKLLREDRDSR